MLKLFRHKGVMKVLLWSVAAVITLSLGILSNAYLLTDNSGKLTHAGKVFGKKISLDEFESNYQFTIIQSRMQYGENFDQIAPSLNLEAQTWERIILLKEAKNNHVEITDNEVVETIQQYPFFHSPTTKKFDPKIYQMVLRQALRITTRSFEEGIRDTLKIKKLFDRQTFAVTVSDETIKQAYKEYNEKLKVSYILIPSNDFEKKVTYDEIKAKNYFLSHKRDFLQPSAINVFYLSFPFNPNNANAKNSAYDKAYNTLSTIRSGETLSVAANAVNIKLKETGFFDIQQPNLELGWPLETFQQLFKMKQGQATDIITTEKSYDILQLREVRPPYFPAYAEVKEDVKIAFISEEAMKLSETAAQKISEEIKQENNFFAAAKSKNLEVSQTPEFFWGQYLPVIGQSTIFQQQAFSLTTENPISGAVRTEKGYAVLHLDERVPADMKKFMEEKNGFGQQMLMQKKIENFTQYSKKLEEKAKLQDLISEHLKK